MIEDLSFEQKESPKKIKNEGTKDFRKNYKLSRDTKVLGFGTFGKVFRSESRADPSFKVAIKVFNK